MKVVAIDRAHGKDVAGKRSPDGRFLEWQWSDDMVKRLINEFKKYNVEAIDLVPEDTEPGLTKRATRANQLVSKYGVDNVIFLSIHVNAAGNGSWLNARGWSAFTSKGKTKSDDIATCLYEAAEECLTTYKGTFKDSTGKQKPIRTDFSDGDPDWEENFTVLVKTKCPAVLTENMFMDNKDDVEYLLSEVGKQEVTKLHVMGVLKHLNISCKC